MRHSCRMEEHWSDARPGLLPTWQKNMWLGNELWLSPTTAGF